MEINYDLFDQVYAKLGVAPIDNIIEKSAIAMKLYNTMTGTTDTLIKIPDPHDMSQYLLPCVLAAGGINQNPRPIILVLSGNRQQYKAINMATDLSGILNDMGITHSITKNVMRGGKENYLCRRRYLDFIRSIAGSGSLLPAKLAEHGAPHNIELSGYTDLTREEKRKICVKDCNPRCAYYQGCVYVERFKRSETNRSMFQVFEPYFFTKQIIDYYKKDRVMRFPHNAAVVIPNPCSLEKAASSIFSHALTRKATIHFVSSLLTSTTGNKAYHQRVRTACERLEKTNAALFDYAGRLPETIRVSELLEKMLKDLLYIQNICTNEFNRNSRIKKEFEYILNVLEDYKAGGYEIIVRSQGIEFTLNTKQRNKDLIQALKYAPIQMLFINNE